MIVFFLINTHFISLIMYIKPHHFSQGIYYVVAERFSSIVVIKAHGKCINSVFRDTHFILYVLLTVNYLPKINSSKRVT